MSYDSSSGPQTAPSSPMALVSLVAGILGLSFVPFMGSIVAVITGYLAQKEIQESAGALGGENNAKAGMILGWIGIGLGIVGFCAAGMLIFIPACVVPFGIFSGDWLWMLPGLLAVL